MRLSASRGLLACTVVIEPSWPVFMAWSMSSASPPRHSPTTIRSGRIRRLFRTRSRMVTSPARSTFGGRVSMQSTWRWWSWSSLASSTVTMRSSFGMNDESTLRRVVLPVPVPPDTTMLSRPSMQARRKRTLRSSSVPNRTRSLAMNGSRANFRMVRNGPSIASGGMTAFTREPSGRRASTIGDDSSMRRPTWDTILSMMRRTWAPSTKPGRDLLHLAVALHEQDVGSVDHHLGDGVVLEQGVDRPVADDVVADVGRRTARTAPPSIGMPASSKAAAIVSPQPHLQLVVVDRVVEQERAQVADHLPVDLRVHVVGSRLSRGAGRRRRRRRAEAVAPCGHRRRRRGARRGRIAGPAAAALAVAPSPWRSSSAWAARMRSRSWLIGRAGRARPAGRRAWSPGSWAPERRARSDQREEHLVLAGEQEQPRRVARGDGHGVAARARVGAPMSPSPRPGPAPPRWR